MTPSSSFTSRLPPKPPGDPVLRARDERLDSLKLLAGQLAHDFNNFIAPILGYASLIKEEVVPNSQAMQYAMALDNSARKSERILENVLLAARPQRRFRPQTIDLSALLEKETQSWLGQLPGSAQIDLQIRLSTCQLTADPTQWQNVFHQLLSNSRFALATGGRLDIALERLSLSAERAEALGLNSVDVCKMAFADHGLGMSPAVLDRAFDPFYSTRSKSLGVGLGLTIVHSVTRLHEGQVLLESQENEGTTVTIYLPMVSSLAEKRAGGSSPMTGWVDRSPPSIGKTVLVADDDPLVLEVVKACLLRSGYDVLVARDGREALEVFRRHETDISLVLSDVTMPAMSGIEFVLQLRQVNAHVPVVLMSGDAEATREEKLERLDPVRPHLLKKPFSVKDLMEVLRKRME